MKGKINWLLKKIKEKNPIILRPRIYKIKTMTYINNHNKNSHVSIGAINKYVTQTIKDLE